MTRPARELTPMPPPLPQPYSDFYLERCKAHEPWLRHCESYARVYFHPQDISPSRFFRDTTRIQGSGCATLHSFHSTPGASAVSGLDRVKADR